MNIRPALLSDAARIADIWNPVIRDGIETFNSVEKTTDDVTAMIADRPCVLVAEAGGTVIGFATYDQFRGGIGYRHTMEHTIILAPEGQGKGAGRALMTAIEDHARAAGIHSLWAGVSGENTAAVTFHRAVGFEEVTTLREVGRKFDRWFDLVLLQKRL